MNIAHADRDWHSMTPAEFEEHRHSHEVKHCIEHGRAFTVEHCAGVAVKRTRPLAEKLWRDCEREGFLRA